MQGAEALQESRRLAAQDRELTDARRRARGSSRMPPLLLRKRTLSRSTWSSRARVLVLNLFLLAAALLLPEGFATGPDQGGLHAWPQILLMGFLLSRVSGDPSLGEANVFERLRTSFPGLVLYRWLQRLPDRLVMGLCWVGICLRVGWEEPLGLMGWLHVVLLGLMPFLLSVHQHLLEFWTPRSSAWAGLGWFALSLTPGCALASQLPWLRPHPDALVTTLLVLWGMVSVPLALRETLCGRFEVEDGKEQESDTSDPSASESPQPALPVQAVAGQRQI